MSVKMNRKELIDKLKADRETILTRKIQMGNSVRCPICNGEYPLGTHYCEICNLSFGTWGKLKENGKVL